MPKRSAGDENGPRRKRRVRKKDGQAQGPLQLWSGTLEFQKGPHSNDQRQPVDIISFKIHLDEEVNTDNWPEQLKMTSISCNGYLKFVDHDFRKLSSVCIFSVDGDCGAFRQYTSKPNHGCVLLEYTSSAIQVMFLTSWLLQGERCVGHIMKYSNNDRTVKLLTDLGILSRVTAYDKTSMAKKEGEMDEMMKQIREQRRALLQKDEALKEKEVEILTQRDRAQLEKEEELTQRDRALSVIEGELRERGRAQSDKEEEFIARDKALSERETDFIEKNKVLSQKQSDLVVKDITLMEKEDTLLEKERAQRDMKEENNKLQHKNDKLEEELQILRRASSHAQHLDGAKRKTVTQPNIEEDMDGILQREATRLELVNDVETKQAALDAIEDMMENEFKCSICAQLFIKTTTLNCSHSFCEFCIKKWLDEKRTCPNCRLMTTSSVRSVVIDNCIEKIVSKLGDEAKQRRKETVREREETITVERYEQAVVIQDDDETDDQSSTVTSPSSSSTYLRSPASMMSSYHPSPASTLSSTWWRSPSSITNMFSPPSVSSTNTASPAAT